MTSPGFMSSEKSFTTFWSPKVLLRDRILTKDGVSCCNLGVASLERNVAV